MLRFLGVILPDDLPTPIAYMTYRHYSLWDHGKKAMVVLTICTYVPVAVMGFIVMVYDFRKHTTRTTAENGN